MRHLYRATIFVLVSLLVVGHAAFGAWAQPGPREPRGTQLYRGLDVGVDPGRPMIAACIGQQPCRFLGLVDPGVVPLSPFIVDSGYFTVCTAGACGTPVPFVAGPGLLGTAVGTGVGTGVGVGLGAAAVVGLAIGLGVGLTDGGSDDVPTPSQ